jgi:hypothetical protein
MSKSEVAQLRRQIELELESLHRGLYALSSGGARHAFINAKMDRVGAYQGVLADQVGKQAATMLVYQLYEESMEPKQSSSIDLS